MSLQIRAWTVPSHYLTWTFRRVFEGCSRSPLPESWGELPQTLRPYLETLYGRCGQELRVERWARPPAPSWPDAPEEAEGGLLLAFSGGKDSVAAALLALEAGYRVTLYHLAGLNRGAPHELHVARALAEAMELPLLEDRMVVGGRNEYTELPVKNQLILAAMAIRGAGRALTYSMGVQKGDSVTAMTPDLDLSDAAEMFESVASFFEQQMSGWSFRSWTENETDSWLTILAREPRLLRLAVGCMAPTRYKGQYRRQNQAKHGLELYPNRCGSCPKCCQEYLVLWWHPEALRPHERSEGMYRHALAYMRSKTPEQYPHIDPELYRRDDDLLASIWVDAERVNPIRAAAGLEPVPFGAFDHDAGRPA